MTAFFRLVWGKDKESGLKTSIASYRNGSKTKEYFNLDPAVFSEIPGSPFAYWVSERVRRIFTDFEAFENEGRRALHGASSKDDFRFLRLWWEVENCTSEMWVPFSKGGEASPFYMDISTYINWADEAREIEAAALHKYPYLDNADWFLHKEQPYRRAVLYQTLRSNRLAPYLTPRGCIFGDNGFQVYAEEADLFFYLGLLNSSASTGLFSLLLGRTGYAIYRNGTARRFPVPRIDIIRKSKLAELAKEIWTLYRKLDNVNEGTHCFIAPSDILWRDRKSTPFELAERIQSAHEMIDDISFDLYGLDASDRLSMENAAMPSVESSPALFGDQSDIDESERAHSTALLSWAVGVAFGRFDWRLATGERAIPLESQPFNPLPEKSPGMLPNAAEPFHRHAGILVDDPGHPHDLAHLVEEVLERAAITVPSGVRRWLQRDLFPFHLQRYSKNRRKAPIYWPLSTASGSYTLWVYYPRLTSQTLYTAGNDFIRTKLKQIQSKVAVLRSKGTDRSRDDEAEFEALQTFELELIELRENILNLARAHKFNYDDGVQITAAPLWPLFLHKPWQKVLKDTWSKLEKGDYDWAHLSLSYWPDRVLRKCLEDRSLAIAHDVENDFWDEVEVPVMHGKKVAGGTKFKWQPKALSETELELLIESLIRKMKS